jgi:hypothetical protein
MGFRQVLVRFSRSSGWLAIPFLLTSCHNGGSALVTYATPGLPLDRYFEFPASTLATVESHARRYDTDTGPRTDIWVSGIALNEEQRRLFDSKALADAEVSALRAPGILIRINDDGTKATGSFLVCALDASANIQCTSSDVGTVVISRLEAKSVKGAFFTDSKTHDRRYAIGLDAPLANVSAKPINAVDAWSDDGGKASVAFSKVIAAASVKDVDTLRSLSMHERAHDWDHFGIITSIQRTALQEPRVIAATQQGSVTHLWVLPTTADGASRLPFRVDMENVGGDWRFAKMIF